MSRPTIVNLIAFLLTFPLLLGAGTTHGPAQAQSPAGGLAIFADSGQELVSIRGNWSRDVALGDLDGDGDTDAFVVQGASGVAESNIIWLNDGEAAFAEDPQAAGEGDSRSVALADFEGDGDLDAAIANGGSSIPNDDEIWINQGGDQGGATGAFAPGQTLAGGESVLVKAANLNDDAYPDLVFAGQGQLRVWWNDGDATFTAGPVITQPVAYDLALGDLDDDGDLDLVVGGEGPAFPTSQVYWNVQDVNQPFVPGPELPTPGVNNGVALAHLDGDGYLDVYITPGSATTTTNLVWWNNGDGTFMAGTGMDTENNSDVALGDLDGDGDVDAYVTRYSIQIGSAVWLNNGDRTFTASGDNLGNSFTYRAALADLDGDGDLDAFDANSGPNKVWLNQTDVEPPPPPPPLPEDGAFYFVQSNQFNISSHTNGVGLGDLDGDGDLDVFLANGETISGTPNELFLNDGGLQGGLTGNFSNSGQLLGDAASQDVALADIDLDGDLDAFVANWASGVHPGGGRAWINDGSGVFADGGQTTAQLPSLAAALADLNQDGDPDAFLANFERPHFVYNNQLTGTDFEFFGTGQDLGTDVNRGYDVVLGDLNDDGYQDAFVADASGSQVWLNDAAPTIPTFTQLLPALPPFTAVALGLLDGDASLDAFTGATVLFGNGDGSFRPSGQILTSGATAVSLADLDGDDDLDAFATFPDGAPNRAWVNVGGGNFIDSDVTLGSGNSQDVALGDIDRDGDVDAFVGNIGSPNEVWLNYSCSVEYLSFFELPEESSGNPLSTIRQATINLQTFRRVRDEILTQSATGQRYTDLYYSHNAEILAHLIAGESLRDDAVDALEIWQPNLQALVDGNGASALITEAQVQAADEFLNALSAVAGPALQQTIAAELARLGPPEDYIGMTMDEASAAIVGYGLYLPVVNRD